MLPLYDTEPNRCDPLSASDMKPESQCSMNSDEPGNLSLDANYLLRAFVQSRVEILADDHPMFFSSDQVCPDL